MSQFHFPRICPTNKCSDESSSSTQKVSAQIRIPDCTCISDGKKYPGPSLSKLNFLVVNNRN